jgi:ATP-dependent DNA helicase RecG
MPCAIKTALREAIITDQVTDQVKIILGKLINDSLSALDLMKSLGVPHRPTFRKNYLRPAIDKGFIEMTSPDKPSSRMQRYRITDKGISALKAVQ